MACFWNARGARSAGVFFLFIKQMPGGTGLLCWLRLRPGGSLVGWSARFAVATFVLTIMYAGSVSAQSLSPPTLSFAVTSDTLVEGGDDVGLSILLPNQHIGRSIVLELELSGTAVEGMDYILVPARPQQGIVRAGTTGSTITLAVQAAPAEPLALLLQPRRDDRISQGELTAELRVVGYRIDGISDPTTVLPAAVILRVADDELPVAERLLAVDNGVACALLNGGSVRCWFTSEAGVELRGALSSANIRWPRQLAIGSGAFCWLRSDNTVSCGPGASGGQLMIPSDLSDVTAISLGLSFACTLHRGGEVRCWGPSRTSPPDDLGEVTQLASGTAHTCALTVEGAVSCWGQDVHGQSSPPMDLPPVKQLVLRGDYSCGLTTSGEVFCWGNNDFGQLSPPDDLGPVAQLAAAALHACALTVAGEVRCWGADSMGELAVPSMTPGGVTAIAAGGGSSCALVVDGSVRCWGNGLGAAFPQLCARAMRCCGCRRNGCVRGSSGHLSDLTICALHLSVSMHGYNCLATAWSRTSITACWILQAMCWPQSRTAATCSLAIHPPRHLSRP